MMASRTSFPGSVSSCLSAWRQRSLPRKKRCCSSLRREKQTSRISRDVGGGRTAKSGASPAPPALPMPVKSFTATVLFARRASSLGIELRLKAPIHIMLGGRGRPLMVLSMRTSLTMPMMRVDVHSSMKPMTTVLASPFLIEFSARSMAFSTRSVKISAVMCWSMSTLWKSLTSALRHSVTTRFASSYVSMIPPMLSFLARRILRTSGFLRSGYFL